MENFLDLNTTELKIIFAGHGFKPFRIKQVYEWIFKKFIFDFTEMTNLSKEGQGILSNKFRIINLKIKKKQEAADKEAVKYLFMTEDEHYIEAVLLNSDSRNTLCISSQAGCPLNCSFCATGKQGFKRNLNPSEILSQVLFIAQELNKNSEKISNIVFMGMGEPFLNYDAVMSALQAIIAPEGLHLGARHITVSTSGVISGIKRFMKENFQVRLAVSLNSPFQDIRKKIMPVAEKNSIPDLLKALRNYQQQAGRRITFEYILLKGINTDESSVKELKKILAGLKYTLNIITYNSLKKNDTLLPSGREINDFKGYLRKYRIKFTERMSKGQEIHAACGQLGLDL